MKGKLLGYIRVDSLRAFGSWRFLTAAVMVTVLFLLNYLKVCASNITHALFMTPVGGIGGMVLWSASAIPFVACFCEDMENRYHFQMMLQGNRCSYLASKIIVTFLSTAAAMFLGYSLFVGILSTFLPLAGFGSEYIVNSVWAGCAESGAYGLYVGLFGLQISMLAGTLSVTGLAFSMFFRNRMLVYTVPTLFLYMEDVICVRLLGDRLGSCVSLYRTGYASLNVAYEGQSWYLAYGQMAVMLVLACTVLYFKMQRRVEHG